MRVRWRESEGRGSARLDVNTELSTWRNVDESGLCRLGDLKKVMRLVSMPVADSPISSALAPVPSITCLQCSLLMASARWSKLPVMSETPHRPNAQVSYL